MGTFDVRDGLRARSLADQAPNGSPLAATSGCSGLNPISPGRFNAYPRAMKTRSPISVIAAAVGPAALFLFCGCSKSTDDTTVQATRPDGSNVTVEVSGANVTVAASDTWDRIKDFAFDRHADFSDGIDRMSKDMDDKTAAFKARTAGVPDAASRDRDSAMKEYDAARSDLKSKRTDLDNATADTWSGAKAKAGESLRTTKAAYDKVAKANAAS